MQLVSVQTTKIGNHHAPEVGVRPSREYAHLIKIISCQSKYYVALSHVLENELHK